jgi:DNA processing protein
MNPAPPMPDGRAATPLAEKYLRLHLCREVGPIRAANLLRELGGIEAVLTASRSALTRVSRVGDVVADYILHDRSTDAAARELELAAAAGVRILCLDDPDYPLALRTIPDPPLCLYLRGRMQKEDAVALAIVGSRHCSRYGAEQAERLASLAAAAGLTIVSGMAYGIDSYAHRGALAGGGRTVAVMGCGLSHVYPPESGPLAEQIAGNGAVISELPMGTTPEAKNFPARNRIIAGLSLGVLVVEAAARSGALITARLATEYNREVFALPGQVGAPYAEGCNTLIKAGGAKLVTSLPDILEELGEVGRALGATAAPPAAAAPALPVSLNEYEQQVLEALGPEPLPVEAVCDLTCLPPARVASVLTSLQLKGVVRRVAGDLYERVCLA